jgi:hypothetical protein
MKHEYGKRIVPMTVKLNALKGHNASEGNKKNLKSLREYSTHIIL